MENDFHNINYTEQRNQVSLASNLMWACEDMSVWSF